MAKFFLLLPAILFAFYGLSEGLECYHCFTGYNGVNEKDGSFVQCNDRNLTLSNTWTCPSSNARCIYEVVEIQATREKQTWRTCSNGITDPCDPNALPPGVKMISCSHCGTDRCNLQFSEEKKSFTFNINANVNLYIRQ